MAETKKLLRSLNGETLDVPPIWMMRQAGRYLPEYRATREKAGDFLTLCYTPELAAEVTLQPIRRFGFDAAILFADILLIPDALGLEVGFVKGEGPKLSTVTTEAGLAALGDASGIHATLSPVYETLRILKAELPAETALIGFAGAPWTVATYMIAGHGTPDQGPAHKLKAENRALFEALLQRITDATIEYLSAQVEAGAEVIKLFDSWAGSLQGADFADYSLAPIRAITRALHERHPDVPVIGFPRGTSKENYVSFAKTAGVQAVAIDEHLDAAWAAAELQPLTCVQGNLAPGHMVTGGEALDAEVRRIRETFSKGPHIFNLGHGITPDADPENVARMIAALRASA
ncbi:uroporphyrinogen decarboxylase [Poseidonocella sp. HB161398]|uniref:uroporphyrinogen decarboxylase n=1 Tax=Poseidonocella sp. HB161398 TaxID=2320855 RepID=UPI001107B487|nr:uroporphyrinogen decarboxylase [Poseidonocella sp. HB161398]